MLITRVKYCPSEAFFIHILYYVPKDLISICHRHRHIIYGISLDRSSMNSFWFSILLLLVWSQIFSVFGNLEEYEDEVLRFKHTRYVSAIKENHKVGKTNFLVKASGCHGKKVTYQIQQTQIPFEVNADSGRISVTKKLNYDESNSYSFAVKAVTSDGKCDALTLVQVDILNVDKNRPYFTKNVKKYHCHIQEDTGIVKVSPKIIVKDNDTGDAGKIMNVQVRESEEPFTTELKQSTGEVLIKSFPSYKFDAQRMASYSFSLQAWDSGDPPRNSPPLAIHCKVVPSEKKAQNNHAPVFVKKEYIGKVTEGEKKVNIVQVRATDDDTDKVFGKICEYFIRTSDEPFSIDNQGVISQKKTLTKDGPDNYVFVVMAKDCDGKMSVEGAMVNIIVDKDCIPAFADQEERAPHLKGCEGLVHLTPKIHLNSCGASRQYADYTASVTMETAHILKGCDRETYEASSVFKMCNVNRTIDLLPSAKQGNNWMAALLIDEDIEGEHLFEFDGKTVLDIPPNVIKYDSRDKMTISTWIWMKQQDKKQFIIAASDPQYLDRKHFGLYTEGEKVVFIHHQEKISGSVLCKSQFTWKPNIFDVRWHHVVVSVEGCNAARLFVDSKEVFTVHTKSAWPFHGSNMATKIVIGARWLGREQTYADYFDGYLGDLSVNTEEAVTEEAINCVFQCKEKLKIDIPAPDSFQVKQKSHNIIEINGRGRPEAFEKLLRGLVYVNTRRSPTVGRRPLQIHATINKQPLPMITMDVVVDSEGSPKLELSAGLEIKKTDVTELRKYGIPISRDLKISADKCLKYLDFAKVLVDPVLTAHESLVNPSPLIDLYNLKKKNLPDGKGFTIHGLATIQEYERVLQEIIYVHLAPTKDIRHTFKIYVSDLNKRFISNSLNTTLITAPSAGQRFDMQALSYHEKDALPGAVSDEKLATEHSGSSLGVSVGVIIACSCLFVFIILVVVIRLRSGQPRIVYSDVPGNESETIDAKTVMNVTMNPLEKLEDLQEKNKAAEKPLLKNKNEKMNLEWDDAYIA